MVNYALYYPTIEFQSYPWLWSASLLWDRIYRIVPEEYETNDPENVRILTETGEIGIPIHPDSYTKEVAEEFLNKIDSGELQAAALEFDMPEAYSRVHQDKVDAKEWGQIFPLDNLYCFGNIGAWQDPLESNIQEPITMSLAVAMSVRKYSWTLMIGKSF